MIMFFKLNKGISNYFTCEQHWKISTLYVNFYVSIFSALSHIRKRFECYTGILNVDECSCTRLENMGNMSTMQSIVDINLEPKVD